MSDAFTPTEILSDNDDDGTIVENVRDLAEQVVGHRIVKVAQEKWTPYPWRRYESERLRITLDNGVEVTLSDTDDCCAYTALESFIYNADKVDHVITGVRTEGGYTKWSIFADAGDVLALTVGWSCGNPFYYGYGFNITVDDPAVTL